MKDRGTLAINGNGKLIVRAGATLCIAAGAILSFENGLQNLEMEPGVVIPAGCINPSDETGVTVSPNPATTSITFNYALPGEMNSTELVIIDAQGRTIDLITLEGKLGQKILDTQSYSPGMYFYRSMQTGTISGKFIIR